MKNQIDGNKFYELINTFKFDGGRERIQDKSFRDQIQETIKKFKEREVVPLLYCAKTYLEPANAFEFIYNLVPFTELTAYNAASEILLELSPQVNIKEFILNLKPEDSINHSLLLNSLPLPLKEDKEIIFFIFQCVKSEFVLNRIAFLNLACRLKQQNPPISPNLYNMIKQTVEKLFADNQNAVQSFWLKAAFLYLKDISNFSSMIGSLIKNGDVEVKAALALRFNETMQVTKDALNLIKDKNTRVVAATIPFAAQMNNLSEADLSPIFACPSSLVRILALRHFESIPDHFVKEYMKDTSTEVRIELIHFLGKFKNGFVYLQQIFEDPKSKTDDSWRKAYEMLVVPFDVLKQIGENAFQFALLKAEAHPLKLMKQAVAVLIDFAKFDSHYTKRVEQFMNTLETKDNQYSLQAFRLLKAGKDLANSSSLF